MKNITRLWMLTVTMAGLVIGLANYAAAIPPRESLGTGGQPGDGGPVLLPSPVTVDQIVHNIGNIVTTVDNWGYIGGYQYYGLPSGEWPRNSGHDYIGEIRYWMGAVASNGDTLVANTYDDFQSVPSLVTAVPQDIILLSTDTTRYYNYDLSDTTGAGYGNPAYGWKVWNSQQDDWVYARNYNPIDSIFYNGGPISVQESHYRFDDAASGSSLMGLEMTHTVLQWNYCYNEDFMFVILEIENTSDEDYSDFAFGLYVDIDVGGFDGTGENGRLGDLVGSDSTENLAWIYDEDGYDRGWGPLVTTGVMGTKYLETPGGGGMTAFRTGDWALVPDEDPGRFELINSTQYDGSLPPTDQYYIQCTRGIDLMADSTVRVVYALVVGADETEFRNNAALAQELYDNYFVGPEPPTTPTLTASAGDEKIYLSWNDTAQFSLDPLSGENDFSGYKLYRSEDRGTTWGQVNYQTGNSCLTIDYNPLALYTVNDPSDPIPHSYIDADLLNGVEYWYCLVAFDTGASETGVDPLQSGFGVPDAAENVVSVTPRTDPAGFLEAVSTVTHQYNGNGLPSEGEVVPAVFDPGELLGADYQVVFEDTPEETYWHLINTTTDDTVLADQTAENLDPDLFEVAEGLRVVIRNADREPRSMSQTELGGSDATLEISFFYGPAVPALTGDESNVYGDAHFRSNYEFRCTGDSTLAPSVLEYWYGPGPTYSVPFEVWNIAADERVSLAVYDFEDDGVWQPYDLLTIVNYGYNPANDLTSLAFPHYYSWMFGFDETIYDPTVGDVYTIEGPLMNSPEDVFLFKADGVNDARARAELGNIKVVPDPYYAFAPLWETSQGETDIQFQNLPEECTIRIYTLAGDLVKTLENAGNSGGTVEWDLQSEAQRLVASGIYIYHVESEYGDHVGRFAVIK